MRGATGCTLLLLVGLACFAPEPASAEPALSYRLEKGVGDRYHTRDLLGRRLFTIEPGVGGRQVIKDRSGRRIGTLEHGHARFGTGLSAKPASPKPVGQSVLGQQPGSRY